MSGTHLGVRARASFTAGGIPGGLVENGVAYFLLIYYNQVLGLSASLAGLALLIALLVDAVSDPLVGYWSDRTRSRFGRRHPFLFTSIVPTGLLYFLLWEPAAESETGLFVHLLATVIGVRLAVTFFNVPSLAMIPELTNHYDERTRLMNYLYSSGWLFGTVFAVAMYAVWLPDTAEHPVGIMNEQGYRDAGRVTAIVIVVTALAMGVGTRSYAARLNRDPARSGSLRSLAAELKETVSDRSLAALLVAGFIRYAASGTSTTLWAYMQPYFWGFSSGQIALLLSVQIISAALAFSFIPFVSRRQNKRNVLIGLTAGLALAGASPIILRLLNWFPENGHPALFPIMAVAGVIQVALIIMAGTMAGSMLMDVVEARELVTRRREEGLLLSVQSFMSKVSTGLGVWLAGLLLLVVGFPAGDDAATISESTIFNLGLAYGPFLMALYLCGAAALFFYRIDRHSHESAVKTLTQRAQGAHEE